VRIIEVDTEQGESLSNVAPSLSSKS
jgi:hypothetical protein